MSQQRKYSDVFCQPHTFEKGITVWSLLRNTLLEIHEFAQRYPTSETESFIIFDVNILCKYMPV